MHIYSTFQQEIVKLLPKFVLQLTIKLLKLLLLWTHYPSVLQTMARRTSAENFLAIRSSNTSAMTMFANRLHKIRYQSIETVLNSFLDTQLFKGTAVEWWSIVQFQYLWISMCHKNLFQGCFGFCWCTVHYFYLWISGSSSITTNTSSPVGNGPRNPLLLISMIHLVFQSWLLVF